MHHRSGGAGPSRAAGGARLEAFRRCAELLVLQQAALDADDLPRVNELGARIQELHAEIDALRVDGAVAAESPVHEEEPAALLRSMIEGTERLGARIGAMRAETGREIRESLGRRPSARRYLSGEVDASPAPPRRLDVIS